MKLQPIFLLAMLAIVVPATSATEPSGYYASCKGKKGAALLSQLQNVVGSPSTVGYAGLWDLFKTSDVHANGKIWDMYSTKEWTPGQGQCGSYSTVGDCYNREHSMPKSWFNDASPMYSDAFHLYPTDGYVNGKRSNYPFGECAGASAIPSSGGVKALGRVGKSSMSGYSGTVFEPDDEYKGDFARSYFYMAAAYNDRIKGWNSDMLNKTSYPAFTTWAIDILLKWHRQDPVSQKEIDRNEVVYKKQKNRNPFIDHPEMAEHIWGNAQDSGWDENSPTVSEPMLILPVDGSELDLGTTIIGVARKATVKVLGSDLDQAVTLSVSGDAFSVSPSTIGKVNATAGYEAEVTYLPLSGTSHTATLTVASGKCSATVNLSGRAIDNLPAGPVNAVGEDSFEATWSYIGDELAGGTYSLDLFCEGSHVGGYPVKVDARSEAWLVEDLEPDTRYSYIVSSANLSSREVEVTTLAPAPCVTILFDGDLRFTAPQGEPSEAAELWVDIANITTEVQLSVAAPFQLSTDKSRWSTAVALDPEEDRVYLRLYSEKPGTFHSSLTVTAGSYYNDNVEFTGTVTSSSGFYEDFEADAEGMGTYNAKFYEGTGARWSFTNAGMWPQQDAGFESAQSVRMGKESNSAIEMDEDYAGGFGTVTLWSRIWSSNDGNAVFTLEYTTDGGDSWTSAGEATVDATNYTRYSFVVNAAGPARIRVRQTQGKRFFIDQIEADNYTSLVADFAADYHTWDAYSRDGKLIIDTTIPADAIVYALDGTEVFNSQVAPGGAELPLACGLYIVTVDDFSRRVLVK